VRGCLYYRVYGGNSVAVPEVLTSSANIRMIRFALNTNSSGDVCSSRIFVKRCFRHLYSNKATLDEKDAMAGYVIGKYYARVVCLSLANNQLTHQKITRFCNKLFKMIEEIVPGFRCSSKGITVWFFWVQKLATPPLATTTTKRPLTRAT